MEPRKIQYDVYRYMFIFIFHFFFNLLDLWKWQLGILFSTIHKASPEKLFARPEATEMLRYEVSVLDQFPGWACHTLVGETMPGLEVNQICHGWFSRWPRRSLVFFFEAADNFPTCSRWFSHSQIPDRWKRKLKSRVLSFIKQALVEKTKIWN